MTIQIDIMDRITEVGGVLAAVLAIGIIALWFEYKAVKKELSELNKVVRDTGKEDMKIIDKLSNTIERSAENDGKILEAVNETLTILKDRNHN